MHYQFTCWTKLTDQYTSLICHTTMNWYNYANIIIVSECNHNYVKGKGKLV